MKKICLILAILVSTILTSNAQKTKVQSAFNYLKNGQLSKAKDAIDAACDNASTSTYAKAWYYKGKIYIAIAYTDDAEFKVLDSNAVDKAYEAFVKAQELDKDKEFADEISEGIAGCAGGFFNQAIAAYSNKNYVQSAELFSKAFNMYEKSEPKSTNCYNSAYYAIASYTDEKVKNYTKAQELLNKSLPLYGDSLNLVLQQINVYLQTDKSDKANELLKKAIEKDPKNPSLYFAIGTTFEKQNNITEAEKAYLKAIELKPTYFDAYYNVGALIFNRGVAIFAEADKLPPGDPNYDTEKVKFETEWKNAQPYLEKALEFQPNDQFTLQTLKILYSRTSQLEKWNAIKDRLKK